MITIKKEFSYGILAIVVIVAIVALSNLSSTKFTATTENNMGESKDFSGKASDFIKKNKVENVFFHPREIKGISQGELMTTCCPYYDDVLCSCAPGCACVKVE